MAESKNLSEVRRRLSFLYTSIEKVPELGGIDAQHFLVELLHLAAYLFKRRGLSGPQAAIFAELIMNTVDISDDDLVEFLSELRCLVREFGNFFSNPPMELFLILLQYDKIHASSYATQLKELYSSVAKNALQASVWRAGDERGTYRVLTLPKSEEFQKALNILEETWCLTTRKKPSKKLSVTDSEARAKIVEYIGSHCRAEIFADSSQTDQMISLLDLNPRDFELLIGRLFELLGFRTEVTRQSRDGGIDCIAVDYRPMLGGKIVIQVKRFSGVVGVTTIRELYGVMQHLRANKGIVITTGGYSKSATSFAQNKPMELIDGDALLSQLRRVGLNKYYI